MPSVMMPLIIVGIGAWFLPQYILSLSDKHETRIHQIALLQELLSNMPMLDGLTTTVKSNGLIRGNRILEYGNTCSFQNLYGAVSTSAIYFQNKEINHETLRTLVVNSRIFEDAEFNAHQLAREITGNNNYISSYMDMMRSVTASATIISTESNKLAIDLVCSLTGLGVKFPVEKVEVIRGADGKIVTRSKIQVNQDGLIFDQ